MAANTSPVFVLKPYMDVVHLTAANTNRDGSGSNLVSWGVSPTTAPTSGRRVDHIYIRAAGTTTAGMIRIFLYDGTNTRLFYEIPVSAITPSATVASFAYDLVRTDGLPLIWMPSAWKLTFGTHNAETFEVTTFGGDYE